MLRLNITILFCLIFSATLTFSASAQKLMTDQEKDSSYLTFSGTKINPYDLEFDSKGKLVISGYIDCYYALYSDSSNASGFSKFPTISPRNNQFALNMAQVSAKYISPRFRSTITLFTGDIPRSAWSEVHNNIQEANMGFQLHKKLWLDVGFFRTHIGLESIQPRENMTLSLATTTYFEPYYLSGAKLTYQHNEKWNFQLNAFNSFNQFLETNKTKAFGLSISHNPNANTSFTYSSLYCDESSSNRYQHARLYNNLCLIHKSSRWMIGAEINYGLQKNAALTAPNKTAQMVSGLIAVRYRMTHLWSLYSRGEFFDDPNEILTGPVYNENHNIVGPKILGGTIGIEYKPIPNSYVRLEHRSLTNQDGNIFQYQNKPSHYRSEFLMGLGVWF
jgi:hypothetical protein